MLTSHQRKANIGNGLLVILSGLLGALEQTHTAGVLLGVFMGLGLTFSGLSGFCGWIRIFSTIQTWKKSRRAPVN